MTRRELAALAVSTLLLTDRAPDHALEDVERLHRHDPPQEGPPAMHTAPGTVWLTPGQLRNLADRLDELDVGQAGSGITFQGELALNDDSDVALPVLWDDAEDDPGHVVGVAPAPEYVRARA